MHVQSATVSRLRKSIEGMTLANSRHWVRSPTRQSISAGARKGARTGRAP